MKWLNEQAAIREGNVSEKRAKTALQRVEKCMWIWRTADSLVFQKHEEGSNGEQTVKVKQSLDQ